MNIHFEWPTSGRPVELLGDLTENNYTALDVTSGNTEVNCSNPGHDVVAFYWHMARPVLLNLCTSHVCLLDEVEVAYGSVCPLSHGNRIQAGNVRLVVNGESTSEEEFRQLIYSTERIGGNTIPDIEDVLPHRGSSINDLRYFNDVVLVQNDSNDVLKTLEVEYRRFLLWQERDGQYYGGMEPEVNHIITTDNHFDSLRRQIKEKTLTECIVGSEGFMDKVWSEFGDGEHHGELFSEEVKIDLLKSLSPERHIVKSKYKVPELVFQDFYKTGLDSYY